MRRVILHSDINCCYAQIECQAHPEIRSKPVVVAGKEELRHGIVLAKNEHAKAAGIKTADTLWEARKKCPGLIVLPPNYELYKRVSSLARRLYYDYTDCVEPFGLDEAWLDITGSFHVLGLTPRQIAEDISERMKAELGVTVSIGISWNKIFAKFGSDYKKPDAITEITPENYRDIIWTAPVRELLYVGAATQRKLHSCGINTIGELAHASDELLKRRFGKVGFVLRSFARGEDTTEVKPLDLALMDVNREVKSYGNGITFPRDITDEQTAKAVIWMLAESVSQRMREDKVRCRTVEIAIRSGLDLVCITRQCPTKAPTSITPEIAHVAWGLTRANHHFCEEDPVRALFVRASKLEPEEQGMQLALFDTVRNRPAMERLDGAIDGLRQRYGNNCVVWGPKAQDADAWIMDAKQDNTVHPVSYFHR